MKLYNSSYWKANELVDLTYGKVHGRDRFHLRLFPADTDERSKGMGTNRINLSAVTVSVARRFAKQLPDTELPLETVEFLWNTFNAPK